jgi:NodT family efflux transporter outer membrane factor (OMF) lipoprotein
MASMGLLTLAGCKVGPDYHPPELGAPPSWAAGSAVVNSPAELREWWTTLNDPTLTSLVERAIQTNLDVRLAAARVLEARAQRGVIAADRYPGVDVGASYSRSRRSQNVGSFGGGTGGSSITSDPAGDDFGEAPGANGSAGGFGTDPEQDFFDAGFDANWEIDVFGRVARSVEAADADIQVEQENLRDVLVTLLSEVARNYVEVRGFQGRLALAEQSISSQREAVDLTRAKLEAGVTSDLDVARAEAQLATTQSQIPSLDAGMRQAIHRLSVLLGQSPATLLDELSSAAPIPVVPAEVPAGLPAELLRRRPDLRRAERELAAATARIGAATADLYPRFSLSGSFGFQSSDLDQLVDSDSRFWSIGPAVRWPVFDAGRIRANIAVQNARTEQALVQYESAVLISFEEVENALVNHAREQVRRRSLTQAVAANQRAYDLAFQLYTRGLSDFLAVLDSQRALYLSQDQLVQSDRTVAANLIALYKALGGGWELLAPEPPEAPGTMTLGAGAS